MPHFCLFTCLFVCLFFVPSPLQQFREVMEEVDPAMVLHHVTGNLRLPIPAKSGAQLRLAAKVHTGKRIWQTVQSRPAASVFRDVWVCVGLEVGEGILKWVKVGCFRQSLKRFLEA